MRYQHQLSTATVDTDIMRVMAAYDAILVGLQSFDHSIIYSHRLERRLEQGSGVCLRHHCLDYTCC